MYTKELSVVKKHTFPFIFNSKQVEYEVLQQIGKDESEPDYVIIEMNGKLTDKRSLVDLVNGLDFPLYGGRQAEGVYFAKYFLDSDKHAIDTYLFECSMNLDIDRKVSIVVAKLNELNTEIDMSGNSNEKVEFSQKVKRFFS